MDFSVPKELQDYLGVLDQFTAAGVALPGAVPTYRALYSPVDQVHDLVESQIQGRTLGFIGQERVNVLELNVALEQLAASGTGG